MLRTIAILLIILAFLSGGVVYAASMAIDLLWLCLLVFLVGAVLGCFDYWGRRPGPY